VIFGGRHWTHGKHAESECRYAHPRIVVQAESQAQGLSPAKALAARFGNNEVRGSCYDT
jgi:hypothetical protein